MIFHQNLTSVSVIAKLGSQVIPTILCHFEGLYVPWLYWNNSELLVDIEYPHQPIFMKLSNMEKKSENTS